MDLKKCYDVPKQLDEKTQVVAKKELNENPKQTANDIEAIRDWIRKESYMRSKMDDDFILAFLRAAKYSYSRAQELIRNYWVNRTEITEWFANRSFEDDSVTMEIADIGAYVKLPLADKDGRVTIVQRIGCWDSEKYEFNDVMKYMFAGLDVVCEDPRTAINGLNIILDMTGMNASHASQMTPARAQRMMKCMQDSYPLRIKAIHYYNYPKLFDAVFPIVKMFMKEKLKKRIKFHGSDLKSLHKEIPKACLPKEYGGDLEPIVKVNGAWVEHIQSRKKALQDLESYGVDLTKIEKDSKAKTNTLVDASSGVTGTFRKLNVD